METMSTGPDSDGAAPKLDLSSRKIVAIEHPCVILNLDKGLDLFGPDPHFNNLLSDGPERSTLPIWFRRDNPTTKPIRSQHASSNGILLKITVPKRTGRKRKRGSDDPFSGDAHIAEADPETGLVNQVASIGRQDAPRSILRKMQDNIGGYQAEAVGMVKDTFRYRGLADFQFATTNSPFLTKVAEHLLPLELSKIRDFKLQTGVDYSRNQEFIPPPQFSDKIVSFNYNYEQNPYVRTHGRNEAGEVLLINTQGRKKMSYGWFIQHDTFPVPTGPKKMHDDSHESLNNLVEMVRKAMDERPIWTRRGLMNHLGGNFLESQLRIAIQIAGYQFKGGPWRDAIIKYGVDPRSDSKYHKYQTMSFKLVKNKVGHMNVSWQTIRKGQMQAYAEKNRERNYRSHFWDGESYTTDGKFWQICDITDPFLVDLIQRTPLRPKCDLDDSGWFHRGFWAKVKLIMKAKMLAIKYGRVGSDSDPVPKDGFIYNAYLMQKLSHIPDDSDEKVVMNVHPLTAPMKDLLNDKSTRRRPTRIAEMQASGKKQKKGNPEKQGAIEAEADAEADADADGSDTGEVPSNADVGEPIEWDEDDFTGSEGTDSDEDEDGDSAGDEWEDELEDEGAVVGNLDDPVGEAGDDVRDHDANMDGETEQGAPKGNILTGANADGDGSLRVEDTEREVTANNAT